MCNGEYISKFTNQLHEESHVHNASTPLAVEIQISLRYLS